VELYLHFPFMGQRQLYLSITGEAAFLVVIAREDTFSTVLRNKTNCIAAWR
jgi:hypothetical protein